ncbi:MAG: hypothetical protein N3C62_00255 [Synergistetes bacterium]|nr:hypothetical protein [Synergistota bacterium]MCX8127169.1 hypothetical protein [Synergistota bacterium]MDW8191945.1 hypothetical protein [Synergistota bacterium]
MADLANCIKCNRAFLWTGGRKVCPRCLEEEEKDFEKVYNYLRDHPRATIREISEATEVDEDEILEFIKQGRIQLKFTDVAGRLRCKRCGEPISSGEYCPSCLKEFQESLSKIQEELGKDVERKEKEKEMAKMYIIDVFKKKDKKE